MSRLIRITASPRDSATGAVVVQRLAGGGQVTPYFFDGQHWKAGIANLPRFTDRMGFDENGWTGGSIPTTGTIGFAPSTSATLEALTALYWKDAALLIETAAESAAPAWTYLLSGTIAAVQQDGGKLVFTVTDLGGPFDRPIVTARFAGNGGLEGGVEAAGRVKRRTWGRAFNVEGRVFDKAYGIYEFGDPAFPFAGFDQMRDIGRAGSLSILAWQGSAAATLAALRGVAVPQGGGVGAPSIAMGRWWTQPNGPLTADIRGEIGASYVETVPEIVARVIVAADAGGVVNLPDATALRSGVAGYHVDGDTETVANALDRLLLPVSLTWAVEPAGGIRLLPITLDAPIETVRSVSVNRQQVFPPMATRRVGYQRAWRAHGDAEISSLLYAQDVAFADGTKLADVQPAEAGADVTAKNTAANTVRVGDRLATEVVADLKAAGAAGDLNAANNLSTMLAQARSDALLDFRTFVDGKGVVTYVQEKTAENKTATDAALTKIALLGAAGPGGTTFILDGQSVQVSPGKSLSERFSEVVSEAGTEADAKVSALQSAVAADQDVIVRAANTLKGRVGTAETSITGLSEIVIGPEGANARALLALNVNGRILGYRATNDGHTGSFVIVADFFAVATEDNGVAYFPFKIEDGILKAPDVEVARLRAGSVIATSIQSREVTTTLAIKTSRSYTGTGGDNGTGESDFFSVLPYTLRLKYPAMVTMRISSRTSYSGIGDWFLALKLNGNYTDAGYGAGNNTFQGSGLGEDVVALPAGDHRLEVFFRGGQHVTLERALLSLGVSYNG